MKAEQGKIFKDGVNLPMPDSLPSLAELKKAMAQYAAARERLARDAKLNHADLKKKITI